MGKKAQIVGAVVLAAAVAAGVTLALTEDSVQTARLVVTAADRGEVTVEVATVGTVQPASTRSLSFADDGPVATVAVRAGNRVTAGQTLATLDSVASAEKLAEARADLAEARSRLAGAETVAVSTTRSAAACPGARACYPGTGVDQVLGAEQEVNRAEKAVGDAADDLDGTVIKAPVAGTVLAVEAVAGDRVRAGDPVIRLADTYAMQVDARFPEADASALAVGQDAAVTPAGYDAPLRATVARVDPVGVDDGVLVRYGVLLSFATTPTGLLIGQSAQVKVRTGRVTAAVRVPSTAVHDVSGGSGAVMVRSGDRSVRRAVAVGLRGDRYTEITDGLAAGEQVVRSWR